MFYGKANGVTGGKERQSPDDKNLLKRHLNQHQAQNIRLLSHLLPLLKWPAPLSHHFSKAGLQSTHKCVDLPVLDMWFTRAGFSSSTGWSLPESPSEERRHWLQNRQVEQKVFGNEWYWKACVPPPPEPPAPPTFFERTVSVPALIIFTCQRKWKALCRIIKTAPSWDMVNWDSCLRASGWASRAHLYLAQTGLIRKGFFCRNRRH